MASQFTAPILIGPSDGSRPLDKNPLSDGYNDPWLQQLRYRHPQTPHPISLGQLTPLQVPCPNPPFACHPISSP